MTKPYDGMRPSADFWTREYELRLRVEQAFDALEVVIATGSTDDILEQGHEVHLAVRELLDAINRTDKP